MKKEEMVKKVKTCIEENINAQLGFRLRHIKEAFHVLTVSNGTIDTCVKLQTLLHEENTLRKTYDNLVQWVLALETLSNKLEDSLDKCLYEVDYEMITAYNIRIIINDAIGLYVEHEKSGSREFEEKDKTRMLSCRLRYGIAHLERNSEPSKYVSCNIADPAAIDRLLTSVEKAVYPHRYQ